MRFDSLKRGARTGLIATVLAVSAITAARAADGSLKAPQAKTLEGQLKYLHTSLVDSFRTSDWKLMEMVAEGIKAAKLGGDDLEIFLLRAERDAALQGMRSRGVIISWGLACRFKLGHEPSLAALRKMALTAPAAVESPAGKKLPQEESTRAWRAYHKYIAALRGMDSSLLVLAMLKEKGSGAEALRRLKAIKGAEHDVPALASAVLAADPKVGWKQLLEFCSADGEGTASMSTRTAVLAMLASLTSKDVTGRRSATFRIEGTLAGSAPAGSGPQLRKTFTALALSVKGNRREAWTLLHTAQVIPGLKDDAAALAALKGIGAKLNGHAAKSWKQMLARYLGEEAKTKSTTAPKTSGQVEKF